VFLVSVKLILMSYKNKVASDDLHKELKEIRSLIQEMNRDSKRDAPKAAPPQFERCLFIMTLSAIEVHRIEKSMTDLERWASRYP